jgi:hypothetical protein
MSGATGKRWWRRNWWGITAVVPLLVAVVVVSPSGAYEALRDQYAEEEVVRPGGDGWASYGGVRLRLTGFGPAELWDDEEQPFRVPGLTAWQATLTMEIGDDPEALLGCKLELEDTAGQRYMDAPQVLGSANDADGSGLYAANCTRPYDEEDENGPFEMVGYFLLPESTEPVALRVSHHTQDAAYVRLEVG